MINILVCGSRGYTNAIDILETLVSVMKKIEVEDAITIIHNGCPDCACEIINKFCTNLPGLNIEIYPAFWDVFEKKASEIRDSQLVNIADYVIAFWDGKSKGTKAIIDLALYNPDVKMIFIENI